MFHLKLRSATVVLFVTIAILAAMAWPPLASASSSPTTTTLAASANSVSAGTVTTLTSTTTLTTGGTPLTRGQITFCDSTATHCNGAAIFGVASIASDGTARIRLRLGAGAYSIKAVFAGIAGAGASTSSAQIVTVSAASPASYASSTAIAATGSVGNYTLTATVTSFGKPATTGTITFQDTSNSNATVASASLNAATLISNFVPATNSPLTTETAVQYVLAGDFNNDGIPDLAVINNAFSGTLGIYLGMGDGTFAAPVNYATGALPKSMALGDFNGDGNLDLVIVNQFDSTVSILLGNGDGTFQTQVTYATGSLPEFATVGDFNHDGILDLAVTNINDGTVSVLLGNGDGTFQTQVAYNATSQPQGIVAGDFNNDGFLDLAVTNQPEGPGIAILLGNGDGTFQTAQDIFLPPTSNGFWLTAGDLRKNGTLDLVIPDTNSANVYVLLGNNDGTFQNAVAYAVGNNPLGVSLGDVNNDGILDLVVADTGEDGLVSVLLGNGDGTFAAKTDYTVGDGPDNVTLADFNGDGLLDLATSNSVPSTTSILLQNHVETATATGVSIVGLGTHNVRASYPGDASHSSSVSSTTPLIGSGLPATTTTLGASPNPSNFGQLVTMTATVSPAPTGSPLGTVSFFAGTTLLGSGTVNSSGVATFSTSALSTGANSISAVYSGNATFAGSTSATLFEVVHPTATTTTTLAHSAATVAAGTAFTLTATVVKGSTPVASGTVNFCDASATRCVDTALLVTAQLKSNGTAIVKLTLGVGAHSVNAAFLGRADVLGSASAPQTLTVTGNSSYPSVTQLSSSGSVGNYTLVATIATFGAAALSGNVSFLDTSNANAAVASAAIDPTSIAHSFVHATGSPIDEGNAPENVVTADFNGDGILDFAIVDNGSATISVFLGNGDGTFKPQVTYPINDFGIALAVGDLNGDGKLDIVTANSGDGNSISVLLGNGDGTFQTQTAYATGPDTTSVSVGDFNNDGILDLAVTNTDPTNGSVQIFIGNGDGTFKSPVSYPDNNGAIFIAVGDFNRDGIADLAVSDLGGTVSVFLGNGDGTFLPQVTYNIGSLADYIVAADLNNDGKLDLVAANYGDNTVSVLLGNGDGTFQTAVTYATGNGPNDLVVGDFNHDGKLDVAISDDNDTTISILFGNGDGTFQEPAIFDLAGDSPWGIAAGDFNGDGLTDLVVTNVSDSTVDVLLNQLTASATASSVAVSIPGTHNVLASYPGDASRAASQSATVPLQGPAPTVTTVALTISPNPVVAGQSVTFTATVTPAPTGSPLGTVSFCYAISLGAVSNGAAVAAPSRKTIRKSQITSQGQAGPCGAGTLLGTGNVNSSGVATLTSTGLPTGTDTVVAVYSGNVFFATSNSTPVDEAVNPPAPTTTTLSPSPSPAAAGQPVVLTAAISPVPTGSPLGTVDFLSGATLLGTGTVNASGVATLTTTALAFGTDSLTAVYSGNALFAASTSTAVSITINPGFAVAASQTPFAVAQGGAVVIPVTVPPIGCSFDNVVTMSASGLPLGATATFVPPTVTPGAVGAQTTLTIQLKMLTVSAAPLVPRNLWLQGLGTIITAGGIFFLIFTWRKSPKFARLALASACFAGVLLLVAGCNGGFAGTPITQAGSYTVTITGTSGVLHPSTTVTVVVH